MSMIAVASSAGKDCLENLVFLIFVLVKLDAGQP